MLHTPLLVKLLRKEIWILWYFKVLSALFLDRQCVSLDVTLYELSTDILKPARPVAGA